MEGMNREQVLFAMGHPRNKSRETQDGEEIEDWVYGNPPGKVTFITFSEGKVVKVREDYANIGGSTRRRCLRISSPSQTLLSREDGDTPLNFFVGSNLRQTSGECVRSTSLSKSAAQTGAASWFRNLSRYRRHFARFGHFEHRVAELLMRKFTLNSPAVFDRTRRPECST